MSTQMALDLQDRTDPLTCPHRADFDMPNTWRCMAHDGTFVHCAVGKYGEPPMCYFEPIDNSAEAVARRLEWMRRHKKGGDECETDL